MTDTTRTIAQNNLAVAHLRANNIAHARLLFASALANQRRVQIAHENFAPSNNNATDRSIDRCMHLLDPEEHAAEAANEAFIYKAGIEIPITETDPNIITPIIIFNTALVHHLLAEQDCLHSLTYLQKAKSLYELACRSQDANMLFEFAIFNNVAMIHREFGQESTANEYFDYLLCAWMVFVDRDCLSHLRQVRGFLLNLPTTNVIAGAA